MKVKGSLWLTVFFLLLGLFGITQSLTFGYWESMVLPLAISSLIFILASVEMARELRRRQTTGEGKVAKESPGNAQLKGLGVVFGWAGGFALGVYLLGFYIAAPLFAFSYLKWRRRSWLVAAAFAIAVLALIYVVFAVALKTPLYRGLIFGAQ